MIKTFKTIIYQLITKYSIEICCDRDFAAAWCQRKMVVLVNLLDINCGLMWKL